MLIQGEGQQKFDSVLTFIFCSPAIFSILTRLSGHKSTFERIHSERNVKQYHVELRSWYCAMEQHHYVLLGHSGPILMIEVRQASIKMRAWVRNCNHVKHWDLINCPCFDGKTVWHRKVITSS